MALVRSLPPTPYVFQAYPRFVYDPATGTSKIAANIAEVPPGWLDKHPDDHRARPVVIQTIVDSLAGAAPAREAQPEPKAAEAAPTPVSASPAPLLRANIITELRSRGVAFNPRAPTATLEALLKA